MYYKISTVIKYGIFLLILMEITGCKSNESYYVDIESISFENKTIKIPQIYSIIRHDTIKLKDINDKIVEKFNLIPNAPAKEKDFEEFISSLQFFEDSEGYLDIKNTYIIKDNFIEISIEGDYVEFEGNPQYEIYQTYKSEKFYVDIINKELFYTQGYNNNIKLKNYFEPKNYLKLLCKTWIPRINEIKKKYPDDKEYEYTCEDCSSRNASLNPFGFEYELNQKNLIFFLESDAYFRNTCYQGFCSPELRLEVPMKQITPLFKKSFNFETYRNLEDDLSRVIFYKKNLENKVTNTKLISGKIDNKYPFLMEFTINKSGDVNGHYIYTSKNQLIELKGKVSSDIGMIELQESLDNKITGSFQIEYENKLSDQYDINEFKWYSSDKSKSYNVKIDDFDIY